MEWENKYYEFGDKELKKLLKKQNLMFELSKGKYKLSIVNSINKKAAKNKNVVIEPDDISSVTIKLFDELNILNRKTLLKVLENAFDSSYDEFIGIAPITLEMAEKNKKQIDFENELDDFLTFFFVGLGYSYVSQMEQQKEYMNYQITKVMNEKINTALRKKDEKEIEENYKPILQSETSLTGIEVLKTFQKTKKSYANTLDNIMVGVVNKARLEVFKLLGFEKVIRISQKDSIVCKVCEKLDGKKYSISKAPDILSHYFCRCYYMPLKSEENDDGKKS